MRIWNAIRRFSGIGKRVRADHAVHRASKRQTPTLRSLVNRGLRMEQFEERMLLSISPSNLSELWDVNAELARAIENATNLEGYTEESLSSATQWVVGLSSPDESSNFHALAANADFLTETPYLPNAAIWEFDSTLDWTTVIDTLQCDGDIEYYYPLVLDQDNAIRMVPNDPLFAEQWNMENTGQSGGLPGADSNVISAWDSVLGTGVVVAIVDDGLQYTHPDLANNYRADLSWDFGENDSDPMPVHEDIVVNGVVWVFGDHHGTAVAGLVGATGNNNEGISGYAPDADLVGIRLDFRKGWTDYTESLFLSHENQSVDIYNNSWGSTKLFDTVGPDTLAALQNGVAYGRGGLGNIYVFAAGNGRQDMGENVNHHGNESLRYTIAVATLTDTGHYASYSAPGSALLISAYADGVYSTDRTDTGYVAGNYDPGFNGTSAAAPSISGIIALILEANPNLTYRDVQHVLAETAAMNDPSNSDWQINGAGYHVNHNYGFGAADASAAVALASNWENVSAERSVSSGVIDLYQTIPDGTTNGVSASVVMDDSIDKIEWAELTVDIDHKYGTDIEVILTSPTGTQSRMLEATTKRAEQITENPIQNRTLTSCFHWGESSEGEWTVEVRDRISGESGVINNFELTIYGTQEDDGPVIPPVEPEAAIGLELVSVVPNSGSAITEGSITYVSPRELVLVFNEGQKVDPATLSAITLKRAGGDDVFLNLNDETVEFGYIGIGDRPNEVVIRFAETLPDDMYQLTILGTGDTPLIAIDGGLFNEGEDATITFNLDLGAQVTAIVPQPVTRDVNTGEISQSRNTIEVYFNNDDLDPTAAEDPNFYSLFVTNETADPNDDGSPIHPDTVTYDAATDMAVLTFALADLSDYGTGAFRLRIGSEYESIATSTFTAETVGDVFDDPTPITGLVGITEKKSVTVSSIIEPQPYDITYPGGPNEQGHRNLPTASETEGHYYVAGADTEYGTSAIYYNFNHDLGGGYFNQITESQKQRTREIFELYGAYLGIDFIEDPSINGIGLTVATGDMRAIDPNVSTGEEGIVGIASYGMEMCIMDAAEAWNNEYNESWFNSGMRFIGHLLGLGYTFDLPGYSLTGNTTDPTGGNYYTATAESMYPGLADAIHGQYIHRTDSIDVDVYTFTIDAAGTVSAEIIAERLDDSSLLDSVITIYNENREMIARNDDYYSEDSFVELTLTPGKYYVAVSSTGNTEFDPNVPCSGEGGTSQGEYDLRVTFLPKQLPGQNDPNVPEHLLDETGTMFDGDADGIQGGEYNFWFDVQTEANTIFVDKTAADYADPGEPLGSLLNPYTQIDEALANSSAGQVVRIVGNRVRDFNDQVTLETLEVPQDAAVGDFNNDGIPDLVAISQDDEDYYVQVYFGINGITGVEYVTPINYLVGDSPSEIKVADLDNDGAEDLVVTNSGEATLSLLMNEGDGNFAPHTTRFTGNNPTALELSDLNGDGRVDLIVANEADNTIGILLSNSVSFFADQIVYDLGAGAQPVDVTAGDVNNDGMVDIVSFNQGSQSISVLLNMGEDPDEDPELGKIIFEKQDDIPLTGIADPVLTAGILADLNGDGTNDLVFADANANGIIVMVGNGDGTFVSQNALVTGINPTDIEVGDSDGDGHLDLFVLNQGSDTVSVFFGLGNFAFDAAKTYAVGTSPSGMAIADTDRNGRPDIVVANEGDETLSILTVKRDQAYEIGYDIYNKTLEDGKRMQIPRDVTVMIDAGAMLKLRAANIDVGSSAHGVDRSEGALQVLGTPQASVYFTSYYDKTLGVINPDITFADKVVPGDWGGLVFRSDIDNDIGHTVLANEGIFLNYVNNAELYYGGGQVTVNSVKSVYAPIHMIESRPTIAFNEIYHSADAAMSADPNSFADTKFQGDTYTNDYDRVGPEIYGNLVIDNSLNGIFVRIKTLAGNVLENLEVPARFDDTDIVHILGENFIIGSTPGGPTLESDGSYLARTDARLAIDPGIVIKSNQARIETKIGSQLIAEGTSELPIIFTSTLDTRYGVGGTFDTTSTNGAFAPEAGDWSGLYLGPVSTASLDYTVIAYGGGVSRVQGGFAEFNAVESHQATLRLTNSELEFNQGVTTSSNRVGREGTKASVIYVKGAQPVLVNNVILNNDAPAISINANSLINDAMVDWGRSTGRIDAFQEYAGNSGPLVRANRLSNNDINGMVVRGEVLSTASIWDDTDMVHVLMDEIVVTNFHTEGGLRLESAPDESLVVKLYSGNAGFTALGTPGEIDDRIGGTLQILGMPGFPVILTSLRDDTVGSGVDPWGNFVFDTDNLDADPSPGDWRSVKLEEYVNDRNVAVVNELELAYGLGSGINDIAYDAQYIGLLAPDQKSGDDNLRLGYDIHGYIRVDDTADADVYSFRGIAGSEVWLDIDATSLGLNSVVELIDADGNILARSVNSAQEDLGLMQRSGSEESMSMDRDIWEIDDTYTTNLNDAGMRLILPGTEGATLTYYVRVTSYDENGDLLGDSRGGYELQIRLQEAQEIAGSTVQHSSIRYASTGIELLGLPANSPLTVDAAEVDNQNNTFQTAQNLGNLLVSDMGQLEVAGNIDDKYDVDWYTFSIQLSGVKDQGSIQWPTIFDIDYADGLGRPDLVLYVFDSTGTLVYYGDDSNITDDQPDPLNAPSMDDLLRGSFGTSDPFIGPVNLLTGGTSQYYVAVANRASIPEVLSNAATRVEPINSVTRVSEDQIGGTGESNIAGSPITSILSDGSGTTEKTIDLNLHVNDYTLNDVVLYVSNGNELYTINPYTGQVQTDVTGLNETLSDYISYGDIVMRDDGRLFSLSHSGISNAESIGNYTEFSTENGRILDVQDDGITIYEVKSSGTSQQVVAVNNDGIHFYAMAYIPEDLLKRFDVAGSKQLKLGSYIAVGCHERVDSSGNPTGGNYVDNLLYVFDENGIAQQPATVGTDPGAILPSNVIPWNQFQTSAPTTYITTQEVTPTSGSNINDGDQVTVSLGGTTIDFEYDLGVVAQLNDITKLDDLPEDGDTFEVGSDVFEFEMEAYLNLHDHTTIMDDEYFELIGTPTSNRVTFAFDMNGNGTAVTGAVPINLSGISDPAVAGDTIAAAINGEITNLGITATYHQSSGTITLQNCNGYVDNYLPSTSCIEFVGGGGVSSGNISVKIDSLMNTQQVLQEIVNAASANSISANTAGNRVAFPDGSSGDFSNTSAMTQEGTSRDGVAYGNKTVEILLTDDADQVATKLASVINATTFYANSLGGGQVIVRYYGGSFFGAKISGLTFVFDEASQDYILYSCDTNGNIYATDNYDVIDFEVPTSSGSSSGPKQIVSTFNFLNVIPKGNCGASLYGLDQGPVNAEGSIYENVLFAVGEDGTGQSTLFAIGTDGKDAPVFANGDDAIAIQAPTEDHSTYPSGISFGSLGGLAFSTLDYNLWHATTNRGDGDVGHGTTVTHDETRQDPPEDNYPIIGDYNDPDNVSFWFGYENRLGIFPDCELYKGQNVGALGNPDMLNTYDLPGGAHGTLTTNTFSLAGYSADDVPILTFNYFLETDGDDSVMVDGVEVSKNAATDTARVFISDDGANWMLLASNTDKTRNDEKDREVPEPYYDVVQIIDGSDAWQQCRIDLRDCIASLDDLSNLQLKFEFTTAGNMGTGDQTEDGIYENTFLKTVAGDQIENDDKIKIVLDPNAYRSGSETPTEFTYSLGYSVILPNSAGQAIHDGDQIVINDGIDDYTFVFDKTGSRTDNVSARYYVINITDGDATTPVAEKLEARLNAVFANSYFAYTVGNSIYLPYAQALTVTSSEITSDGTAGLGVPEHPTDGTVLPATQSTNKTIAIAPWWTAEEVAYETAKVMNSYFLKKDCISTNVDYTYDGKEQFFTTLKQDGNLITLAGYHVIDGAGPHSTNFDKDDPNVGRQPGDRQDVSETVTDEKGTHFYDNLRGQDNQYEGFYIDDVVIGFAERGMMVTNAEANTTFTKLDYDVEKDLEYPYDFNPNPIYTGQYQLTIRTASEYTVAASGFGTPVRSMDTNDRNTQAITLLAPAAGEIANNDSFTISDGVDTQTFQFRDSDLPSTPILGAIPIYFQAGQSAQEIAYNICNAINAAATAGLTEVTAGVISDPGDWENGSNRVDLSYVASVDGIDYLLFGDNSQNVGQETEEATLVAHEDVTGDGVNDIIAINAEEKTARVFYGTRVVSTGGDVSYYYTHYETIAVGAGTSDIAAQDLTGDGYLDLIVSNYIDDTVMILVNAGVGYFNEPITIAVGRQPTSIELADLNGNGYPDLVVSCEGDNAVEIYEINNSGGNLLITQTNTLAVGSAPKDLAIGRFNNDSHMDIVTANSGDNTVSTLLADGMGGYLPHIQASTGRLPVALTLFDINKDGYDDVVTANRGDNTISILVNDQSGLLFTSDALTLTTGADPVDVQVFAPTGPGDVSIATVNYGDSTLTRYRWTGSKFIDDGTYGTYGGPTSFVFGEINSDDPREMLISDSIGQVLTALWDEKDNGVYSVSTTDIRYDSYDQEPVNLNQMTGDTNHEREQGYVLISSNEIINAAYYGIMSDAGTVDDATHPGAVAPLREINTEQLVSGISISNNLIVSAGGIGIYFSGADDATDDGNDLAIPFGRIVNNTIYGSIYGVAVDQYAGPTLLNNIVSGNLFGIYVDDSSESTTVIGGTVYHQNDYDTIGTDLGYFPIVLEDDDPLFVDAANHNFYLAEYSLAIDSAVDSLEERESLANVTEPLGFAPSPILSPEYDLYGQQRSDDPKMPTPSGQGLSPFKDRGAIDRIDFTDPTAKVIDPMDNDAAGIDRDDNQNDVFVAYEKISVFGIQLLDPNGVGIDDNTVLSSKVKIYKDGSTLPLIAGRDYFFSYDSTTNVIRLYSGNGFWDSGSTYEVVLDNSEDGIADIAGNPIRFNRYDGRTSFIIAIASFDYGDAPDGDDISDFNYPTLLGDDISATEGGARHLQIGNYYLGDTVTGEDDANFVYDEDTDELILDAEGDAGDDGIVFSDSAFMIGGTIDVTITASRNGGYLNAWIDFNNDGDWDDPGEKIFDGEPLKKGENEFVDIDIPTTISGEDITKSVTYARFRYSSEQYLDVGGEAPDGEVEDYQVHIVNDLLDYGDAPESYGTTEKDHGACHMTGGPLWLGSTVDNEIDGVPHPEALGDDQIGIYDPDLDEVINDEDGIEFLDYLQPGATVTISVTSSAHGYLNAWIDFDGSGDWKGANEQIANKFEVFAGQNLLQFDIPADAIDGMTFARFRLFSDNSLVVNATSENKVIPDGEVEDYAVMITTQPRDFGDAPRTYYTRAESESATALLAFAGKNNDILMTAVTAGTEFNDIDISIVNEIVSGNKARVTFNLVTNTYLIDVDPEATTAQAVIDAINDEGTFIAVRDVTNDINNDGTGLISVSPGLIATTSEGYDGYGEDAATHDLGSGLKLGTRLDAEFNGNPSDDATGDDEHGSDDEDGFGDLTQMVFMAGEQTELDCTVTMPAGMEAAYLSAWIDINQDGEFSDDEQMIIDKEFLNSTLPGDTIKLTIPIETLIGETFVRFRLSSQAGLDWYGSAPDGEIEDYKIEVLKGDATISGYAFQDTNYNEVWDANEEGRVGVLVYMDLDKNGDFDFEPVGGGPGFDPGIDIPSEPYAITMDDDPATIDVDETGYYEFSGLFGQVAPYTVRQITPEDCILTAPDDQTFLPDGSYGNVDGSYSILLEDGELVENVNFGIFQKAHVSVGDITKDITVVEGNVGSTDIDVTVTLTHSFGADLEFSYQTQDGSATVSDGDYVPSNGIFTFDAQSTPVATWTTTVLTTTETNDYDYSADGQFVVWEGFDGNDWEIYLFAGEYDIEEKPVIHQLTDNLTEDRDATVLASRNMDGTFDVFVAWSGDTGVNEDDDDTEIFVYKGNYNQDGILVTQAWAPVLTNNSFDDWAPKLSDTYVTWWGNDGRSNEIFYYEMDEIFYDTAVGPAPQNLTENDYVDKAPIIQGSNIVWIGNSGRGNELYLFTGEFDEFDDPIITKITNNTADDKEPQIDGNNIVWEGKSGGYYQIFVYQIDTGTTTKITSTVADNRYPQVSGDDVVWQYRRGSDWEIYHYNVAAGTSPVNISNNYSQSDEHPEIINDKIVWRSFNGENYETYYHKLRDDGSIVSISDPETSVWYPHITNDIAVWRSYNGENYDIVVATQDLAETTQTIRLRVKGDVTKEIDETFFLNLQAMESDLVVFDVAQAGITILNDDGRIDYGDAPESYSTLLIDNGARHMYSPDFTVTLGTTIDNGMTVNGQDYPEVPQPSENCDGDDNANTDDEDGVFINPIGQGTYATIKIKIGGDYRYKEKDAEGKEKYVYVDCYLDAWIDFEQEGNWDGIDDKIFDAYRIFDANDVSNDNIKEAEENDGVITLPSVWIPEDAVPGLTAARFRLSSTGGLDYTGQVSGGEVEDYQVEIIAKPVPIDRSVTLSGTSGDDEFIIDAGDTIKVTVNGASYSYNPDEVDQILFDGGAGKDTVIVNNSEEKETVELWPTRVKFTGANNSYIVDASHIENVEATAKNIEDSIIMTGSTGDDTFISNPEINNPEEPEESENPEEPRTSMAILEGDNFSLNAYNFKDVTAFGGGGNDRAKLSGSTRYDTYEASPGTAQMISWDPNDPDHPDIGEAHNIVTVTANDFRYAFAYAVEGGTDKATLRDSAGFDTFTFSANPEDLTNIEDFSGNPVTMDVMGTLASEAYELTVYNFSDEIKVISQGGQDEAHMTASPGADHFLGKPMSTGSFARLEGSYVKLESVSNDDPENDNNDDEPIEKVIDYRCIVQKFRYVTATAIDGDNENPDTTDAADLSGSSGSDTFTARPNYAKMSGKGYYCRVDAFPTVTAEGGGESQDDAAFLYDSKGNDFFSTSNDEGIIYSDDGSYWVTATDFKHLTAIGGSGGVDSAEIHGSTNNDIYMATADYAKMSRNGHDSYYRAIAFQTITAYGMGGEDVAYLYDTVYEDLLTAKGSVPTNNAKASIYYEEYDFLREVYNFHEVRSKSSNSGDKKDVEDSVDFLFAEGYWEDMND